MVVVVVGAGLHLDAGKLAVIALIVVAAASYAAADGLIADSVLAHFGSPFRVALADFEFARLLPHNKSLPKAEAAYAPQGKNN